MKRILFSSLFILSQIIVHAGTIKGTITDDKGNILSFASILIKNSSKGVVANSQGKYSIHLQPGQYTIVCQYVGYRAQEKNITLSEKDLVVDFSLSLQELSMPEVVINRGEDPAIEIMKQTIRKRNFYNEQVDSFSVEVYIKGLMRSRNVPDRFMGQKIEKEDMVKEGFDSSGKGILFLSESLTRVDYANPDKIKMNVISSRQSGGGYGISFPFFINFYTENVSVFSGNLNPRGFISPLADNAFHYYHFRYEGNFFEGDKMIDRIRVTPKRKNEPLFDGHLQIIDGEWRIHSLDLLTTQQYQLELIDTLKIIQIHAPVTTEVWRTQNQVVYLAVKMFGFDVTGNFLNVYNDYTLNPGFEKKHFNRILMTYDTNAGKKDSSFWANIRPVQLEADEKRDFIFKDSLRQTRDSFTRKNIDSLRKQRKPVELKKFFFGGVRRTFYSLSAFSTYRFSPLSSEIQYNTVEGLSIGISHSLDIRRRKGKLNYFLDHHTRFGFSNHHLNSYLTLTIKPKSDHYRNRHLLFSGGKRMSQFNPDNPIDPLTNSVYTLLYRRNYSKFYENWFGRVAYNNRFDNGITFNIQAVYENRLPLMNAADFSFFKKDRVWLPNHPVELSHIPFEKHQSLVSTVTFSFQPGQYYIQYPGYKMPVGSKYPVFEFQYSKGIKDILGSDVDFDKWKMTVSDEMNFRLQGTFKYKIGIGGFFNTNNVEIPDLQHFNGNQTFFNDKYLNSFQLAPYYRYSNKEAFYTIGHIEHHFNGMLTNKIPLFNKLKWNLVAGGNSFYVNRNNYYFEAFAGIENILKFFRVDFVTAWQAQPGHSFGIRVGLGGLLGAAVRVTRSQ